MEDSDGRGVKDFHELIVWQKAHQLTLAVYQITATFPREEIIRVDQSTPARVLVHRGQSG
jgi:hypothetical protein